MRFNGDLLMMGLGGVVGKFAGDAITGNLAGWAGVIVQFLIGGFALGIGRGGGMARFMTGFGV